MALPRLLGAFPHHRRGATARRGRNRIHQFVPSDGKGTLLFGPVPIGECGGLDLEGQSLVCRVGGDGAEVGEAPPTIALFSSGVAMVRLLEATLGRSARAKVIR